MRRSCFALVLVLQGCFASSAPVATLQPADVAELEARARADSADLGSVSALAALYMREGRPEEARALIAPVAAALPADPAMPLLLAVADELEGDYASARDRYDAYRRARAGRLAQRAEQRLGAVQAAALRMDVRASLQVPVDPNSGDRRRIAVLPFARSSNEEAVFAEAVAVAALIGWDLSDGWDVVNDARVRVLLEELDVPVADLADLSLGIEVGRRLGAARVVQGNMRRPTVQTLEWDVTVISLDPGTTARVDHFTLNGSVGQVLPLEQRTAVMVRESLEDRLLVDRSEAVYTVNPGALSSLGRGLLAMDRDDPAGAREAFREAAELDGAFLEARALVARMDAVLAAPSLNELAEEVVRLGELQRAVEALRTSTASAHHTTMSRFGRSDRAAVPELLGLDALVGGPLVDLTFVLPGG